ncbi:MAG: hypothetical protein J6V22_01730, partial [Clostridia bacterium]|nr:hypothetical protein [Clostridia bacterium]
KVQIDKQTSDLNAIKIAEGYDMKVPFKYGGNVFVKMDDGNVYRIEARSAGTEKQKKMYENLLDAVGRYRSEEQKGSEDSTFDAEVEDQEIKNLGITADFKIGNNYTVRYGGKDYKVQYDNKFYDDLIPTAKDLGVKNDGVFRKGEDLYILTTYAGEDRVFKLENRPVFGRGDYGELVKALGTKTDSSSTEPTIDTSGYKKVADVSISNTGGNDFKITYGDKTYNVQFGDVASDDIKNAADALGVKEKELFTYDGGLYVKMKNNTYKVEARPNQSTGNYASLINALGDQYGVGYSSAFTLSGVDDMKKGDDITLTDVDGKEHTVESAGLATGVTVPSGIPDSVPFVVEDKAYIKVNGKVYGIRKKNAIYTNSYKSLIEKLKASQG